MISVISLVKGVRAEVEFLNKHYDIFPDVFCAEDSNGNTPLGFRCKYAKQWMPIFIDLDGRIRPLDTSDEWTVRLAVPASADEKVGTIHFVFVDFKINKKVNSIYANH